MANANHTDLHHAAERVINSYRDLRDAMREWDYQSPDFPVGAFAALVAQIQALEQWLEPADEIAEPEVDRADFLLLKGSELGDAIYAVRALGRAIGDDDRGDARIAGLAGAIALVGEKLETAIGSVGPTFEIAVARHILRERS